MREDRRARAPTRGVDAALWRSRWRRRPSSPWGVASTSPPPACSRCLTPSRTGSEGGSGTRSSPPPPRGWDPSRRPPSRLRPSTLTRGSGTGRLPLPAKGGQLPADLIEGVLHRLEALGDGPQPACEPVDVVAGRQVQVADRARARLRGALPGAEGDLQRLVQPRIVDQELGELAQSPLSPSRDPVSDSFAAALVHIVHTHGTAPNEARLGSWLRTPCASFYCFSQVCSRHPGAPVPRCKALGESVASAEPAGAGRLRPADPYGSRAGSVSQ